MSLLTLPPFVLVRQSMYDPGGGRVDPKPIDGYPRKTEKGSIINFTYLCIEPHF
jgi:hypothetical protein